MQILSKSIAVVTTLLLTTSNIYAGEQYAERECDEHEQTSESSHDREPYEDYGCVFVGGRWLPPVCEDYHM